MTSEVVRFKLFMRLLGLSEQVKCVNGLDTTKHFRYWRVPLIIK